TKIGDMQTELNSVNSQLARVGGISRAEPSVMDTLNEAFQPGDPLRVATLLAKKLELEKGLAQLPDPFHSPVWEFPRSTIARRISQGLPHEELPLEQTLSWLWNPPAHWPNVSHLFDYMGNQLPLWNPFR